MNRQEQHIKSADKTIQVIEIDHADRMLKKIIWLYFFLLIFEGALRKWFLPGLAAPLLIIRDPVAVMAMFIAYKHKRFPDNIFISLMSWLSLIGIVTAMTLGHGNLFVAIYGARIIFFHLPFMFIVGQVFDREDVIKLGKVLLIIAIPMVLIIAGQFYSPQSAWINRGVGGNMEGGGFSGAGEYFRPPGTFSFTGGNIQFFSMVATFVFYFWFDAKRINKLLLISATFALIAAVPLSISRSLLFQIAICFTFTMVAVSGKPKYVSKLLMILVAGTLAILILKDTEFFKTSTGAFTERFETANEGEGGLEGVFLDRFLGGLVSAFNNSNELPFFGYGLGMGTNVGAQLLVGSTQSFLIAEVEWGRLVGEMGFMLGLVLIGSRTHLTFHLMIRAFNKVREGDFLPWLLMSFGFLMLWQGQWSQPTSLGFSMMTGGLVVASMNNKRDKL